MPYYGINAEDVNNVVVAHMLIYKIRLYQRRAANMLQNQILHLIWIQKDLYNLK
jgi:hypothetical protein